MSNEPLIEINDLKMHFPIYKGVIARKEVNRVKAVDGLTFNILEGETLGLVGESGCGKSTTGRAMIRLYKPTAGSVKFRGTELVGMSKKDLHPLRRDLQMIFQDPYASLNPRMTVGDIIAEPIRVHNLASGSDVEKKDSGADGTCRVGPAFYPALSARILWRATSENRHRACFSQRAQIYRL